MAKDDKRPAFDPSRFAMPSTGAEEFGTRKIRSVIPVNRPGKMEWVHLLDHPDFLLPGAAFLDLQDGGRLYLVVPEIAAQLTDDVKLVKLAPGLTRQDKLFLKGPVTFNWMCNHIPDATSRLILVARAFVDIEDSPRIKLTRKHWECAGITDKDARSRVIAKIK